jgi:hypothetical protein
MNRTGAFRWLLGAAATIVLTESQMAEAWSGRVDVVVLAY